MGWACSAYGERRGVYRILVGKREGKRRAGRVARMGRGEVYTGFWWGNVREREHLEDPCLDGRIILR